MTHATLKPFWSRTLALLGAGALLGGCHPSVPPPYSGFLDEPVAAVAAQTAGQIESISVREGDRVKKGQLIAQLESSERKAAVAVAQANVEQAKEALKEARANLHATTPAVRGAGADIKRAQATLDEAQTDFERTQRLVQSEAMAPAALDSARARLLEARAAVESLTAAKSQTQGKLSASYAAVDNAEAAVHSAQAALSLSEAELEQTRILSPFDGVVVSRNLEEGEWAAPGTPVVTVEDTSHPWVRLDVEETDFRSLALGERADIHVIAIPGRTFEGRVEQIGAEGDFAINRDVKRGRPDIRTFLVRVAFDQVAPDLRPGMTAEVRLQGGAAPASSARPLASGRAER
jgi:HlyD family secretion protein